MLKIKIKYNWKYFETNFGGSTLACSTTEFCWDPLLLLYTEFEVWEFTGDLNLFEY